MRALALFLAAISLDAGAQGMLLWDAGMPPAKYAGKQLFYPGAPEGGRAAPGALPIALIDSGVAASHPQLEGFIAEAADFTGEGPQDLLGHGTALALIAVFGESSFEVKILSAKVADRSGRVREQDVIDAIDWAVRRGAKAVSVGVGFHGTRREYRALCDAIAGHWNVLFFAAVGNVSPPREVYPANCRIGNLHPVWADPAQPRADPLVAK